MAIQSLSTVTLATIENYRAAANQFNHAYRLRTQRLIGAVNASLNRALAKRAAELAPQLTGKMMKVRGRVTQIVSKGIDKVAHRTEKAVDFGTDRAVRQVHKVADFAAGIDNPTLVNGLRAAARLSLPSARVALALSGRLADRAKALSKPAKASRAKAPAVAAAAPVKRRARRQVAVLSRKTTPVVRRAAAAPKKAARATRKTA